MKGTVSGNFIVLLRNVLILELRPLFYFIFSNNVRKRLEATNDLEFYFYFPGQKFRTTL